MRAAGWAGGLFVILHVILSVLSGRALGATHLVPEDYPTIQAAIDASAPQDSILIARGTYTGSANASLSIPPIGLVIASREGREVTILDGELQRGGPGLTGISDPPVSLSGLTIQNCVRPNAGGGLRLIGSNAKLSSLVIRVCVVWNWGSGGGGTYCENSSPVLTDVLFEGNGADAGGGAGLLCWGDGNPKLTRVQFVANWSAGLGDGMKCIEGAVPTLSDVKFYENGSGLRLATEAFVALEGLEFRGNGLAASLGGSDIAIEGCVFTGNGLAVSVGGADIALDSVVFVGNGGAIHADAPGAVSITSCTIAHGDVGVNGAAIDISGGGQLTLTRSIVAFNENQLGVAWDGSGPAPVITCSDVFGNSLGNYSPEIGDQTGIGGNVSADPIFCGAINGPSFSYTLEAASVCLPAGNDCGVVMGAFGEGCQAVGAADLPSAGPALLGNYPNPFAPATQIVFSLPAASEVSARVYDVNGRRLATLLAGERLSPGVHRLPWQALDADGRALPAGVYPYVLEFDGARRTGKLLVVR